MPPPPRLLQLQHQQRQWLEAASASARVWRGTDKTGAPTFPEQSNASAALRELQRKPNNGLALSGGGTSRGRVCQVSLGVSEIKIGQFAEDWLGG